MKEFFTETILTITSAVMLFTISTIVSAVFMSKTHKREKREIDSDVTTIISEIKDSENIIDLMIKNVAELREYYVISKQQARKSFSAALTICILGFILFAMGIITSYFSNQNVVTFTTISGGIVEVISGLFFFMYKNSLAQLNIYHERLGATEKYLTAMQLIEKMTENKRDENYRFLMEVILIDNSSIVRNKTDKPNN